MNSGRPCAAAHCVLSKAIFGAVQRLSAHSKPLTAVNFSAALSCGCAFAPHDGTTYLGLLKCASSALDHAKRHGKNRMEVFSSATQARLSEPWS